MAKVKTEGLLRKLLPAFVFFAAAALAALAEIVSLYADMELDTYSVWLRGISTAQMWARQEKYFALNGKNTPDYIFFDEYTPYDIALDGYEVFDRGKYTLLVKSE